jgi:hypothetical protein
MRAGNGLVTFALPSSTSGLGSSVRLELVENRNPYSVSGAFRWKRSAGSAKR